MTFRPAKLKDEYNKLAKRILETDESIELTVEDMNTAVRIVRALKVRLGKLDENRVVKTKTVEDGKVLITVSKKIEEKEVIPDWVIENIVRFGNSVVPSKCIKRLSIEMCESIISSGSSKEIRIRKFKYKSTYWKTGYIAEIKGDGET